MVVVVVCVCMCVYLNDAFQALLAINVTLCANKRGTDKFFFFFLNETKQKEKENVH